MAPRRRRNSNEGAYPPVVPSANTESPKKKRRTSKRSPTPTPAPDPSTWRESKVSEDSLIKKTDAEHLYRLKPTDLDGLTYTLYESKYTRKTASGPASIDAHLYKEREVERRAWEKYGGPEGFEQYLSKLHKSWSKRQKPGSFKKFPQPSAYAPTEGCVSIVRLPPRLPDEDPYATNAALRQLKREFPAPWLWTSCNKALGDPGDHYYSETYYSRSNDRLDALRKYLDDFRGYPPRPRAPLPPSQSVDQLRKVLDSAPCQRGSDGLSSDDPHLDFHYDHFTGDSWYSWAVPYLTELFDALNAVIDEHGLGDAGWRSIRWEVYDKYSDAMIGIYCDHDPRKGHVWGDEAYEWLVGRYEEDNYGFMHLRGKCDSGRLYNDKLSGISSIQ